MEKQAIVLPTTSKPPSYRAFPDALDVRLGVDAKSKRYFIFGKNAALRSKRSKFSDKNDLINYLKTLFGVSGEAGEGLRMRVRSKGRYRKVGQSGKPVYTSGDPVLDLITDDQGKLVLGDVVYDMQQAGNKRDITQVTDTAATAKFVDEETGQSLTFHAWDNNYGVYWKMGVEIETSGGKFEQAQINSQYGENIITGLCGLVAEDNDMDANDSYLDEYEWGVFAPKPTGVRAQCGAIWLNERFSRIVQAGGCDNWDVPPPTLRPFSLWSVNEKIPGVKSKAAPALAAFNNRLHMVFLGETSNDLYHWIFNGTEWAPAIGSNGKIPGQKSKDTPALAVRNDTLHMVHLGDTSNDIWYSTFNGSQWSTNVKTGQKSKASPALAVSDSDNVLHMVHIGDESNNLYHRVLSGAEWTPLGANNGIIPNQKSKAGPALTSFAGGLLMTHLGDASNDIWYTIFDNGQWTGNQKTGQKSSATPGLFNSLMVHIGSSTTTLWESELFNRSNWQENIKIPGQGSRDMPALARAAFDNRIYMVHLGESSKELWISHLQ